MPGKGKSGGSRNAVHFPLPGCTVSFSQHQDQNWCHGTVRCVVFHMFTLVAWFSGMYKAFSFHTWSVCEFCLNFGIKSGTKYSLYSLIPQLLSAVWYCIFDMLYVMFNEVVLYLTSGASCQYIDSFVCMSQWLMAFWVACKISNVEAPASNIKIEKIFL